MKIVDEFLDAILEGVAPVEDKSVVLDLLQDIVDMPNKKKIMSMFQWSKINHFGERVRYLFKAMQTQEINDEENRENFVYVLSKCDSLLRIVTEVCTKGSKNRPNKPGSCLHTLYIFLTYFEQYILYTYFTHMYILIKYFICIQYIPGCINLAGTELSAKSKIVRGQTFHTVVQIGHNARVLNIDPDIEATEGEDITHLCKLSPGERPLDTIHMITLRYSQS